MSSSLPTGTPDEIQAAFLKACSFGGLRQVKALLAAGADPKAVDQFRQTPLHSGWLSGHVGLVELLLRCGADPRVGRSLIAPDEPSSSFVLTTYARKLTPRVIGLVEALLGFKDKSALDAKKPRGAWAIAVVRGILFKHGASTESRVEEVPEGPAVGGAGRPGPGVS